MSSAPVRRLRRLVVPTLLLVDVRVVNPVGTSPLSSGDVFTYTVVQSAASQAAPTTKKLICAMPKLRRHSYHYARRLLRAAGCRGVPVLHKGHAEHPPSHVKSQSPRAGKPLYAGGKIKLRLR